MFQPLWSGKSVEWLSHNTLTWQPLIVLKECELKVGAVVAQLGKIHPAALGEITREVVCRPVSGEGPNTRICGVCAGCRVPLHLGNHLPMTLVFAICYLVWPWQQLKVFQMQLWLVWQKHHSSHNICLYSNMFSFHIMATSWMHLNNFLKLSSVLKFPSIQKWCWTRTVGALRLEKIVALSSVVCLVVVWVAQSYIDGVITTAELIQLISIQLNCVWMI